MTERMPVAHWNRRLRRLALSVLPMLTMASLPACVPHKLYNDLPEQYLQEVSQAEGDAVPAHLAVIEFDDHGMLWKREQLEDTIALIQDANRAADDGTLVIVYIHGWKNNADPDNADGALAQFRDTVRNNAARNPADRPFAADRIVGVFLGWRGDTSNVPLQEQLTFWDRRQAGERVASVHMQETLLRVMSATKERDGSKCFIVGHSMGGMIVGRTMAPILTTLLLSQPEDGTRLPVDLVLLQNPALDALASWQTIDLLKRFDAQLQLRTPDGGREPAKGPMLASITSEADTATSRAYPFGRTIASFGTTASAGTMGQMNRASATSRRAHSAMSIISPATEHSFAKAKSSSNEFQTPSTTRPSGSSRSRKRSPRTTPT